MGLKFKIEMDYNTPYYFENTGLQKYLIGSSVNLGGAMGTPDILADGKLVLKLNNDTGIFNPLNTASPYYDKLRPNVRVRFLVDNVLVFAGFIKVVEPSIGRDKVTKLIIRQGFSNLWEKVPRWEIKQNVTASDMLKHLIAKTDWYPVSPDHVFLTDINTLPNESRTHILQTDYTGDTGITTFDYSDFVVELTFKTTGKFRFRDDNSGNYLEIAWNGTTLTYTRYSASVSAFSDSYTVNQTLRPILVGVRGNTVRAFMNKEEILSNAGDSGAYSTQKNFRVETGTITVTMVHSTDAVGCIEGDSNFTQFNRNFVALLWERDADTILTCRSGNLIIRQDFTSDYRLRIINDFESANITLFESFIDGFITIRAYNENIHVWQDGVLLATVKHPYYGTGINFVQDGTVRSTLLLNTELDIASTGHPVLDFKSFSTPNVNYTDIQDTSYKYTYLTDEWEETTDLKRMLKDLVETEQTVAYMKRDGTFVFVSYSDFVTGSGLKGNETAGDMYNLDEKSQDIKFVYGEDIYNESFVSYYTKIIRDDDILWASDAVDRYDVPEGISESTFSFEAKGDEEDYASLDVYPFTGVSLVSTISNPAISVEILDSDAKRVTLKFNSPYKQTVKVDLVIKGISITSEKEQKVVVRDIASIEKFRDVFSYSISNKIIDSKNRADTLARRKIIRYSNPTPEVREFQIKSNVYNHLNDFYIGRYLQLNIPSQNFSDIHLITGERHEFNHQQVTSTYNCKNIRAIPAFIIGQSALGSEDKLL